MRQRVIKTKGFKVPVKRPKKRAIKKSKPIKFKRPVVDSRAVGSSGEKVINAWQRMVRNSSTASLKIWIKITVAAICLVLLGFSVYTISQMARGNVDLNLVEGISTDKENVVSAEPADTDDAHTANNELLKVVNRRNKLEKEYEPVLYNHKGDIYLSKALRDDLKRMFDKAHEKGIELDITKGYISYDDQQAIYENAIEDYRQKNDCSIVKAEAELMHKIPDGESCERRTGLVVSFGEDGKEFSESAEYNWLFANCTEYGFVLRYPPDKTEYTGYEPSYNTFRYVGAEDAKNMRMLSMCLEEYISYLSNR